MWPWEHLAVGYLCYSALTRYWSGDPPTAAAAVAVAFGTQFPDVVDKPLGWGLSVVPSGVSVAHSVFTATALSAAIVAFSRRANRGRVGTAFVVGYLSHLPADAVYGAVFGGRITVQQFLWPLVESTTSGGGSFLDNVAYYAIRFLVFLTTDRGLAFLSLEVLLLSIAAWVWFRDGCPGIPVRRVAADPERTPPRL